MTTLNWETSSQPSKYLRGRGPVWVISYTDQIATLTMYNTERDKLEFTCPMSIC
jgi:hypothetical protein